jgi:hypothetical protein
MAVKLELEQVIEGWDGEQLVVRFDEPSGTWMFVCIHSRRLGPAAGGTHEGRCSPRDSAASALGSPHWSPRMAPSYWSRTSTPGA